MFLLPILLSIQACAGEKMDESLAKTQKEWVLYHSQPQNASYEDWQDVSFSVTQEEIASGDRLLSEGKVACLLLAGGQGSRLGAPLKGAVGVSVIQNKSLFQVFAEKTFYAGRKYGRKFPLVIMTSLQNHEETVSFFKNNNYFGLSEDQVFFFSQQELPFCDENGDWITDSQGEVLKGPDGNGRALHHLYQSGVLSQLQEKGVQHIQMLQIDNPLADPFDAGFIGFHHVREADISMISVTKESDQEKAGMLASDNGALRVVEYTEKQNQSFSYVNIGLYCFTASFIEKLGKENLFLPWHMAYKKVDGQKFGWKFEYFIFDVFVYAKKFAVLIQPRSECFSPLKNATGDKSLDSVQRDLLLKDRKKYEEITHKTPPEKLELSFAFYYPRKGEEKSWKTLDFSKNYYLFLENSH